MHACTTCSRAPGCFVLPATAMLDTCGGVAAHCNQPSAVTRAPCMHESCKPPVPRHGSPGEEIKPLTSSHCKSNQLLLTVLSTSEQLVEQTFVSASKEEFLFLQRSVFLVKDWTAIVNMDLFEVQSLGDLETCNAVPISIPEPESGRTSMLPTLRDVLLLPLDLVLAIVLLPFALLDLIGGVLVFLAFVVIALTSTTEKQADSSTDDSSERRERGKESTARSVFALLRCWHSDSVKSGLSACSYPRNGS